MALRVSLVKSVILLLIEGEAISCTHVQQALSVTIKYRLSPADTTSLRLTDSSSVWAL